MRKSLLAKFMEYEGKDNYHGIALYDLEQLAKIAHKHFKKKKKRML